MNPTLITIIGFLIIFIATTLGACFVFFFKKEIPERINSIFLGFAAGVMIAAAIWSLLLPAIEQSESWGKWNFVPVAIGFLLGGIFIVILDKIIPHFHKGPKIEEGPSTKSLKKSIKLFLAVTIHNIPEGLAVGFAFSGASRLGTDAAYISALGLAIGIAIQNLPEGASVALPLKNETGKSLSAFLYGSFSGIVEPIAALFGFFLASNIGNIQPWFLSFAAGAMIFVVAEDLIPDAMTSKHSHIAIWGVMIGFVLMMCLEIALG